MKKVLLLLLFSISLVSYRRSINENQFQNKGGAYYKINKKFYIQGKLLKAMKMEK